MSEDFCLVLRQASRLVTRLYEYYFRGNEFDIRYTQFSILGSFIDNKDKSITDVSISLGMNRSTVSRNIEPLISRGFLTNISENGKEKIYSLTEKGMKVLDSLIKKFEEAQDALDRCSQTVDWAESLNSLSNQVLEELDYSFALEKQDG